MKTLFAAIGLAVFLVWLAGSMGIGHYFMYYGVLQIECKAVRS